MTRRNSAILFLLALGLCGLLHDCEGCLRKGEVARPAACNEPKDPCTICNRNCSKRVTLRLQNTLKEPYFTESHTLLRTTSYTLFHMLQEAATANSMFKFSCTYYSGLGFLVDSINNVIANHTEDKSFWEILNSSLHQIPVGVSTYKPKHGETVTFNLTQLST